MPSEAVSTATPANRLNEKLDTAEVAALVNRLLKGLRFGNITLTLHDGQVVQTERTEKVRLR